jgi:hypothetical protein
MLNIFTLANGRLFQEEIESLEELTKFQPIWVDLEAPTLEEKRWIKQHYRYTLLSASASYCSAQKFFNLEAKGASLLVTAVDKAEDNASGNTTLQFRFNPKRGDFELIGRENVWNAGKEEGRTSVNYLTGKFITSERVKGRLKVSKEKDFRVPSLAVLSGFNCDAYDDGVSP